MAVVHSGCLSQHQYLFFWLCSSSCSTSSYCAGFPPPPTSLPSSWPLSIQAILAHHHLFFMAVDQVELFNYFLSCWLSATSHISAIQAQWHTQQWLWLYKKLVPFHNKTFLVTLIPFSSLPILFPSSIISGLSHIIFSHSRINSPHQFWSFGITFCHLWTLIPHSNIFPHHALSMPSLLRHTKLKRVFVGLQESHKERWRRSLYWLESSH